MFSKIFLTKFLEAIKASWNGKIYQGACLLVATCCSFLHPYCSLLQIAAKVKYTQHAADIYLQSSNWDHSGNLVHQIVVSIAFLIKFSKSVGHCCKCREAVGAFFSCCGLLKLWKFSKQVSIYKMKTAITQEIITFKICFPLLFCNLKYKELATINPPKCSNLQQPLFFVLLSFALSFAHIYIN